MTKIPNHIIPQVYNYAKLHYEGKISLAEAKRKINSELGMNESSAGDFVMNLRYMLNGEKYSRTLNQYATDYYLKKIYEGFGESKLSKAVSALAAHISYYENLNGNKMPSQRAIFDRYSRFGTSELDIREQEEIIKIHRKNGFSRKELIEDLKGFKSNETSKIESKLRGYKRDNRIISKLKLLRGNKCQICKTSIQKKDGSLYSEAAHIKPKYEKGSEDPSNLLILCPNHHKEFDYGDRKIITHNEDILEFELNRILYKINMELR